MQHSLALSRCAQKTTRDTLVVDSVSGRDIAGPRLAMSRAASPNRHRSPSPSSRHKADKDEDGEHFEKECKAVFLTVASTIKQKLTRDEFTQALQHSGRNPSKKFVQEFFPSVKDADKPAATFDDFVAAMKMLKPITFDALYKMFRKIDLDDNGYLTYDELVKALTKNGEKMPEKEVHAILTEADTNGDGKLDYKEFCEMMISTAKKCRSGLGVKGKGKDKDTDDSEDDKHKKESLKHSKNLDGTSRKEDGKDPTEAHDKTIDKLPREIEDWKSTKHRGSFQVGADGTISTYYYKVTIPTSTTAVISIKQSDKTLFAGNIDVAAYLVGDAKADHELVAYSASKVGEDSTMKVKLKAGKYVLLPFTTGCRLRKRTDDHGTARVAGRDGKKLTTECKAAVTEVFERADLDMNGRLSREEFDLLQLRTTGEKCDDETWDYMMGKFDTKDGEITKQGFVDLYGLMLEMEGEEAVLKDLQTLGFNSALGLDEACPFVIRVHCEKGQPDISVIGEPDPEVLVHTVLRAAQLDGKKKQLGDGAVLYAQEQEIRTTLVVANEKKNKISVTLDCSQSRNCVSHRGSLKLVTSLAPGQTKLGHHLMREKKGEWSVKVKESVAVK